MHETVYRSACMKQSIGVHGYWSDSQYWNKHLRLTFSRFHTSLWSPCAILQVFHAKCSKIWNTGSCFLFDIIGCDWYMRHIHFDSGLINIWLGMIVIVLWTDPVNRRPGASVIRCKRYGLLVNRSSDWYCTRGMICSKIHLISSDCPRPSIARPVGQKFSAIPLYHGCPQSVQTM